VPTLTRARVVTGHPALFEGDLHRTPRGAPVSLECQHRGRKPTTYMPRLAWLQGGVDPTRRPRWGSDRCCQRNYAPEFVTAIEIGKKKHLVRGSNDGETHRRSITITRANQISVLAIGR